MGFLKKLSSNIDMLFFVHVPWAPPDVGLLKLNFDSNCMREVGFAGYGGVIQNDLGFTVLSFAGPILNGSVIEVELFTLWRGILESEKLGVKGSIVEGDSKVVVGWALGSQFPWIFLDQVEKIRHTISQCLWVFLDQVEKIRHTISLHDFQVTWAHRLANSVTDDMTCREVSLSMKIVNSFFVIWEGFVCNFFIQWAFSGPLSLLFFAFTR